MSSRKEDRKEVRLKRKSRKRLEKQIKKDERRERRAQRRAEGKGFGQVMKKIGTIAGIAGASILGEKLGISSAVQNVTKHLSIMSNKTSKAVLGSPKTTIAGILGFVALLATQFQAMFDGDPTTMPDWAIVATAAMTLILGLFAKDGDVSSKKIGLDD